MGEVCRSARRNKRASCCAVCSNPSTPPVAILPKINIDLPRKIPSMNLRSSWISLLKHFERVTAVR